MNRKLNALFLLVLSGLLLGIAPQTRLVRANDEPAGSGYHDLIASASVQFILVHIERETLDELVDESSILTLDSISLEKIGQCIHTKEGAEIISQTKLSVINGHEAEMTVVENEKRKAKNADEENNEQDQREAEVFVGLKPEILDENTLAVRFTYKRRIVKEAFYASEEAVEEEGVEQKFEIASAIVLQDGQACIVGANLNEGIAKLLIMKADLL